MHFEFHGTHRIVIPCELFELKKILIEVFSFHERSNLNKIQKKNTTDLNHYKVEFEHKLHQRLNNIPQSQMKFISIKCIYTAKLIMIIIIIEHGEQP